MKIGILSDTHGKADMAALAVRKLIRHGAAFFIHCGDVCDTAVLDHLAGHPSVFVLGNNDFDRAGLERYAQAIGITYGGHEFKLSFNNKLMVVTHGDDECIVRRVLNEQMVDYLFVGHSHQQRDQRVGKVRIINPGALYRAPEKTVALLDSETDALEFLAIK